MGNGHPHMNPCWLPSARQYVEVRCLPAGIRSPVTKEALQAPAGLSARADAVWTGNHLKLVRFAVENKTPSALNIRESDFWQPGIRAVMFSQPVSQLLAGTRMDVYVIRDGEGS